MCVRTLFQRAPRTGAGDPKQREQPVRLAARRAGLTAWRSPRTSMPVVGESSRIRRATSADTSPNSRAATAAGSVEAIRLAVALPLAHRLARPRLAPSRPPDSVARWCHYRSGAAPKMRSVRAQPSRPALRQFPDRAALSMSCHCWQEPAATRPPQPTWRYAQQRGPKPAGLGPRFAIECPLYVQCSQEVPMVSPA